MAKRAIAQETSRFRLRHKFVSEVLGDAKEQNSLFSLVRAYFLAAAEVDEWKNSCNADAIATEIVKWGFGEFKVEQNQWVGFLEPIKEGARTALPQTNRIKAIAALVELIGNPQLDDDSRSLVTLSDLIIATKLSGSVPKVCPTQLFIKLGINKRK